MKTDWNDAQEAVTSFLVELRVSRRLAQNTIVAYERDLSRLLKFAADKDLSLAMADSSDIEIFVRALMLSGLSPRSVARTVACVRGFYRFLVLEGVIPASPADDVRAPRAWPALARYLSLDEVDLFLAQPDTDRPVGVRDRALLELLYATGMRVSELVGLSVGDILSLIHI